MSEPIESLEGPRGAQELYRASFPNFKVPDFFTRLFGTEELPKPLLQQIKERRFTEIRNPIERSDVESAVDSFREFCELPDEVKEGINIPGENGRGKGSLGFVEREPETDTTETEHGKKPEHKAYFHYRPEMEAELREKITTAGLAAEALIQKLRALWIQMELTAFHTLQQLERENAENPNYSGLVDRFFPDGLTQGEPKKRQPKLTLRIMLYKKVEGEESLSANNHNDAGAFTFAVCESAPGLQVGSQEIIDEVSKEVIQPERMEEVQRPEGTILFWPGKNFQKHIDSEIEPTWHGVRQHTTNDVEAGEENRYVLVFFLDEYNEIPPTLGETHGTA